MRDSGLTEFIPFIRTSVICSRSSFLVHLKEWQKAASRIPPVPLQSPWAVAASARWQSQEASFTFGGQKPLMAVHFLFIDMAGDIFISHRYPQHPEQRAAL